MKNESLNPKKEKRTERIDVRLTKSEYDAIVSGMKDSIYTTKGAYLRARLLNDDALILSKRRYSAILTAGKLRDAVKGPPPPPALFTKIIQTKQNNLKESDKALIAEIGKLALAIEEQLQHTEI